MSLNICNECEKEVRVGEGLYIAGTFHHKKCLDTTNLFPRHKPKKEHNVKEANYEEI